ncbi:hypothetical protein [Fibrobacter sp.]|nr:hypothetical protein [Fibrobacter sp.]MDD7498263.1 hypothetical protein [Fibrobacter sp.]
MFCYCLTPCSKQLDNLNLGKPDGIFKNCRFNVKLAVPVPMIMTT